MDVFKIVNDSLISAIQDNSNNLGLLKSINK
jgi:hypothetical protein